MKKATMNDFEQPGGIAKLEKDGMNREQIMKNFYKVTDGLGTDQRREVIEEFFDRRKS